MKVIKKGVKITYFKNGAKNYQAFVVFKGRIFNKTLWVSRYDAWSSSNVLTLRPESDSECYIHKFDDEEEAFTKLNEVIDVYIINVEYTKGWKVIKTETKYIN
jgi:hypothetical protein